MVLQRKNILIIEDHNSLRLLLAGFLKRSYHVTTKKDGLEGLAWLGKGNIPDLILLDLDMPNINGFEFLKNIRISGFFKDIPVVVVSGNSNDKEVNQAIMYGVKGYFTKPFNPIKLKKKLNTILQQYSQTLN